MAEFTTDVVVETTTTTGTGSYSMAGAMSGARTFVGAFSTGSVVRYMARTYTTSKWEIGYGTITAGSPDVLTRNVIASSNANALIDWQTGDGAIYVHTISSADDLAKIRGTHRGTTAPTAPLQAGMLWADTSAGVAAVALKYYDAGGAWITLSTINETTNLASPPAFGGDSGSGGYAGAVPAPAVGDRYKTLRGDGTWAVDYFAVATAADSASLSIDSIPSIATEIVVTFDLFPKTTNATLKFFARTGSGTDITAQYLQALYNSSVSAAAAVEALSTNDVYSGVRTLAASPNGGVSGRIHLFNAQAATVRRASIEAHGWLSDAPLPKTLQGMLLISTSGTITGVKMSFHNDNILTGYMRVEIKF